MFDPLKGIRPGILAVVRQGKVNDRYRGDFFFAQKFVPVLVSVFPEILPEG